MGFLRQLVRGIAQAWVRLSASARVNIVVAAMITVALVVGMVVIGSRPQLVRLYSRLELDDTAAIESYLRDEDIPYKIRDDGGTVLVPVQERTRLRVALMEQGIPKSQGGAPGFELFDERDLMTNQWLQNVNYVRAVQGTLQRQLNEFDFVRQSFVFIREAEDQLFVNDQVPSEAAVTLETARSLSASEIRAVLGVVSSFGGANLNEDNITLTTTGGDLLHLPARDEFASIASSKLEYRNDVETRAEQRIAEGLRRLGVNAVVRVNATIDYEHRKETTNKYEEGTVLSEYTTSTTVSSNESLPEGAPGARSQLPEGVAVAGGTQTEENTEETYTNYEPTKTLIESVHEPGEIKGLKVAAFIEGETQESEDGQATYAGLDDERVQQYKDWIATAVGVSTSDVTVYDHPFKIAQLAAVTGAAEGVAAAGTRDALVQYGIPLFKLVLLVMGFLLVRFLLRRAMVLPTTEVEEEVPIPEPSSEDLRRREVAAEVDRLSQQEPETVAALLRSWLSESEG